MNTNAPFKVGQTSDGRTLHYSVGIMLENNGAFLLFPRRYEPLGYAGPAGHIDEGENDPAAAALRELEEELGICLSPADLVLRYDEDVLWNHCYRAPCHHWWLYRATAPSREFRLDREEARGEGIWLTPPLLKVQTLEPVWKYWFEKEGII